MVRFERREIMSDFRTRGRTESCLWKKGRHGIQHTGVESRSVNAGAFRSMYVGGEKGGSLFRQPFIFSLKEVRSPAKKWRWKGLEV